MSQVAVLALVAAIVLSMVSRVNVGLVAIGLAWIVGRYAAGLSVDLILGGFPSSLFLTLTGVALLFAAADTNGTLERLAHGAVRLARGSANRVPLVVFAIACLLSAVGPGAVSTVALVAPLALAIGAQAGVSPFLTSLMVANGANAGNLSPISAVGVIANDRMQAAGIAPAPMKVLLANLAASAVVALAAYVLLRRRRVTPVQAAAAAASAPRFEPRHWITLAVIAIWIGAVVTLRVPLGPSAIVAAVVLLLGHLADETRTIARVPWGVIVMVTGVTMLVAVVEASGGLALFTDAIAALATPASVNAIVAGVTGTISLYSSTSGVVLPAFLPTVPGLVEQLGGGDPLAISLSINIGSSLVDVSPLSTLGALCLAAIVDPAEARPLFRQLMLWGVAMVAAGAILAWAIAGAIARF